MCKNCGVKITVISIYNIVPVQQNKFVNQMI